MVLQHYLLITGENIRVNAHQMFDFLQILRSIQAPGESVFLDVKVNPISCNGFLSGIQCTLAMDILHTVSINTDTPQN